MKPPARLIDSHVHFYDRSRPEGISWPPDTKPYPAKANPSDLIKAARPIEVTGVVLVETGARPADDQWLLTLAQNDSLIMGVVANLQPLEPGFEKRLEYFTSHSKLKGIRLRPIDQFDLKSKKLGSQLKRLSSFDLTLELGATTLNKLEDYISLARLLPDTRCGLTHFGHPLISGHPAESRWRNAILELSSLPNTFCKFTSFEVFYGDEKNDRKLNSVRRTIDFLLSAFGDQRVVFGSNWPHHSAINRYAGNLNLYEQLLGQQIGDLDNLLYQNAVSIYNLHLVEKLA